MCHEINNYPGAYSGHYGTYGLGFPCLLLLFIHLMHLCIIVKSLESMNITYMNFLVKQNHQKLTLSDNSIRHNYSTKL